MPKIIDKTLDEFYEEDRRRALQYVPEWRPADEGDFGLALLRIFSHMREEIASRLNRVPEKNFAAFLSMIGTAWLRPDRQGCLSPFILPRVSLKAYLSRLQLRSQPPRTITTVSSPTKS